MSIFAENQVRMDTMNTQVEDKKAMLSPYVSVDCVLLGIDDDKLCVLLAPRNDEAGQAVGYKLPGSLIYENEDLDDAAARVLNESTGLRRVALRQFRCFGSPSRTADAGDVAWLEATSKVRIGRLITVVYLALCKRGRSGKGLWCPIDGLPPLPFDHRQIIEAAIEEIRRWIEREPAIVFDYLPQKFTAFQLRHTYEVIYNRSFDVRNFHKKMSGMEYVVPTDEREDGVAHRAARYYRFDKVRYNQFRSRFK